MKIGIVSDSHGNLRYLKQLAEKLKTKYGAELVIHLGDDSEDTRALEGLKVLGVPGVYEGNYYSPETERRSVEEFGGVKFLLTHTPRKHANDLPLDPSPEELAAGNEVDVVLYGHTHTPKIELKRNAGGINKDMLWVNPGHLKENDNRGSKASYGIITVERGELEITIHDFLTDEVIIKYP